MYPLLPLTPTLVWTVAVCTFGAIGVRWCVPRTLRSMTYRLGATIAAGLGLSLAVWAMGPIGLKPSAVRFVWTTLPILSSFVLPMPLWALALRLLRPLFVSDVAASQLPAKPCEAGPAPAAVPQLSRRQLVQGLVTLPMLGAPAMAGRGFVQGAQPTRIVRVPMYFPNLPTALAGIKILQLSDLHLGPAKQLPDLDDLLARASVLRPDMVVLTGDVGEDLRQLEAALALVARFGAPLGTFSVLGNHEYISGIDRTLPIYLRGATKFLRNGRADLRVRGTLLSILGVDDPAFRHDENAFYEEAIQGLCEAPSDFRLLLCHRPTGFDAAARQDVELTLAGHTHGGQFGYNGRSLFEHATPYVWGPYSKGNSQLYTTSGFGHWFPYRLGCPAEAALIELARG